MGKMDQIGIKRGKIEEKILGKMTKKLRKKPKKFPNLINAQNLHNNRTGWIFPPKIINSQRAQTRTPICHFKF